MDKKKAARLQMQEQINSLMTEYSRCRKAGESKRRLNMISGAAYMLIMEEANTVLSRELFAKLHGLLKSYRKRNTLTGLDPGDVVHECFMDVLEIYDEEKDPNFWAYFHTFINRRLIDAYRKETSARTKPDGTEERIPRNLGSLDDMLNYPDTEQTPEPPDNAADQQITAMLSIVVRFEQHLPKRSATPTRLLYFRCFVTDYMICISRAEGLLETVQINEHEAFEAMDDRLLAYVLTDPCRTLVEIRDSALQTYEALEIPDHTGPVNLPLEGFVLRQYLLVRHGRKVTDPAISQQRKLFEQLLGIDGKKHTWSAPEPQPATA